jgi:hypothetical protein
MIFGIGEPMEALEVRVPFADIRDVISVFHAAGDASRHFAKHHPKGRTVHSVTMTGDGWKADRTLTVYNSPAEDVLVVGHLAGFQSCV